MEFNQTNNNEGNVNTVIIAGINLGILVHRLKHIAAIIGVSNFTIGDLAEEIMKRTDERERDTLHIMSIMLTQAMHIVMKKDPANVPCPR